MGLQQCCGYFGSFVLVLISSIALLVLLLTYFKHIRTLFYVEGDCTITASIYTIQYSCCGRGCKSFYPCLLLYCHVNSTHLDAEMSQWPVSLYKDDWQQMSVLNDKNEDVGRCSTRVCHDSTQMNRDSMQLYKIHHEPGTKFKCYFHPSGVVNDGAVLTKTIHWSLAVHVTLWPGLGILTGMCICTYTIYWMRYKRKKYDFEESTRAQFDSFKITDPYNNLERY